MPINPLCTLLVPSIDITMRDVIILDDDEEGTVSCSEAQRGLSEAQKSRMMQQKQLALARLRARKVQETPLPFRNSAALPQPASSTSVELRSRPLAGDCKELASSSTGNGWTAGSTSDEWQNSWLPNQGYHNHSSSSEPVYQPSESYGDGLCADRTSGHDSHSSSTYILEPSKDGNRRYVPNRNQEYWDADFDQGTQAVSRPLDSRQNLAQVPTKVVGEWRSVRKRPAPGSSFGVQISSSSSPFKPPSVLEHGQMFKSQKISPNSSRPNQQLSGI